MSTLVAQTISNGTVSTSSANVIQGSAKAWVNYTSVSGGAATITASYNVSSVTQTATAAYTINFTNAFVDSNYAWAGCAGNTVNVGQNIYITGAIANLATWKTASALQVLGNYANVTRNADTANCNYSIIVMR